jgi:Spy/CpxP family protein refolding chaperone
MSVFERVRLLGFGVLAVTFLAGALVGAVIDRALTSSTPVAEARTERSDDRERSYIIDRVEMSEGQRATIDSILEQRVRRMRAVWREVEPELDAITDSARTEIMGVLTPDQRAEYESMLRRRSDRDDDRRGEEESHSPDRTDSGGS